VAEHPDRKRLRTTFETVADYDALVPHPDNRPPPAPEEVGDRRADIEASGLYRDVEVRRHLWDEDVSRNAERRAQAVTSL
jgi:hypothetical protein